MTELRDPNSDSAIENSQISFGGGSYGHEPPPEGEDGDSMYPIMSPDLEGFTNYRGLFAEEFETTTPSPEVASTTLPTPVPSTIELITEIAESTQDQASPDATPLSRTGTLIGLDQNDLTHSLGDCPKPPTAYVEEQPQILTFSAITSVDIPPSGSPILWNSPTYIAGRSLSTPPFQPLSYSTPLGASCLMRKPQGRPHKGDSSTQLLSQLSHEAPAYVSAFAYAIRPYLRGLPESSPPFPSTTSRSSSIFAQASSFPPISQSYPSTSLTPNSCSNPQSPSTSSSFRISTIFSPSHFLTLETSLITMLTCITIRCALTRCAMIINLAPHTHPHHHTHPMLSAPDFHRVLLIAKYEALPRAQYIGHRTLVARCCYWIGRGEFGRRDWRAAVGAFERAEELGVDAWEMGPRGEARDVRIWLGRARYRMERLQRSGDREDVGVGDVHGVKDLLEEKEYRGRFEFTDEEMNYITKRVRLRKWGKRRGDSTLDRRGVVDMSEYTSRSATVASDAGVEDWIRDTGIAGQTPSAELDGLGIDGLGSVDKDSESGNSKNVWRNEEHENEASEHDFAQLDPALSSPSLIISLGRPSGFNLVSRTNILSNPPPSPPPASPSLPPAPTSNPTTHQQRKRPAPLRLAKTSGPGSCSSTPISKPGKITPPFYTALPSFVVDISPTEAGGVEQGSLQGTGQGLMGTLWSTFGFG